MFGDKEEFYRWIESECCRYLIYHWAPPSNNELKALIRFTEYLKGRC